MVGGKGPGKLLLVCPVNGGLVLPQCVWPVLSPPGVSLIRRGRNNLAEPHAPAAS